MEFYAHSQNTLGEFHLLAQHLWGTARLARTFAGDFDAGDLAYLAGLWHDIGKVSEEFQKHILSSPDHRGPDHSTCGTVLAHNYDLTPLSILIAGHHGGLDSQSGVFNRIKLAKGKAVVQELLSKTKAVGLFTMPTGKPPFPQFVLQGDVFTQELFLRMLFSCLVDADFLDTERHFHREKSQVRRSLPALEELEKAFLADQAKLSGKHSDPVNHVRHQVYQHCLEAAKRPPCIFRLIAPTGSGKTRLTWPSPLTTL